MKQVGPYQLPLHHVEVLHKREAIFDLMLDLKIPNMETGLKTLLQSTQPYLLAFNKAAWGIVGVLMYQPPEAWKAREDQDLLAFVAPNMPKLIEYIYNQGMQSPDMFQKNAYAKILEYLEKLLKANEKPGTYTYTVNLR
jgi:hypothetical protein